MDWLGGTLVLAAVTCLVLGLQWGGNTKPWSSGPVIATLVLGPVLFLVTIAWERFLDEKAMVPRQIFAGGSKKAGSIVAIIAYAFATRFNLLLFSYYVSQARLLYDPAQLSGKLTWAPQSRAT